MPKINNKTAIINLLRNFSFKIRIDKVCWTIGVFAVIVAVNTSPLTATAIIKSESAKPSDNAPAIPMIIFQMWFIFFLEGLIVIAPKKS